MTFKDFYTKYQAKQFGEITVTRCYKLDDPDDKAEFGLPTSKIYIHENYEHVIDLGWCFLLEHRCDEWVIGELDDAKNFAECLQEAIEYCDRNP